MTVYFGHYPGGSSIKNWSHMHQMMLNQVVQEYDYGPDENLKHYGSEAAPVIDFSLSKDAGIPIAMYNGKYD